MKFSDNRPNFWSIRLLLGVTGFNQEGGITQYRSENELVSSIPRNPLACHRRSDYGKLNLS